MTRNDGILLRR